MTIPIFHVDAFAEEPFEGNPAAVCLLGDKRSESWMQAVASEMNLSATAFVRQVDQAYELRWFTPAAEIALCGHGTLAAAQAEAGDFQTAIATAERATTLASALGLNETVARNRELIELYRQGKAAHGSAPRGN